MPWVADKVDPQLTVEATVSTQIMQIMVVTTAMALMVQDMLTTMLRTSTTLHLKTISVRINISWLKINISYFDCVDKQNVNNLLRDAVSLLLENRPANPILFMAEQ